MKKSVALRITAVILVLCTAVSLLSLTALAVDTAKDKESRLERITELVEALTYEEYKTTYQDVNPGKSTVVIDAVDYDKDATNAAVEVKACSEYKNRSKGVVSPIVLDVPSGDCLYTPGNGTVVWNFDMPEGGIYNIEVVYYPISGNSTTPERCLRIDGKYPFKEVRSFKLYSLWQDNYVGEERENAFAYDIEGNEIRPTKEEKPSWLSSYIFDASGYESFAYDFYIPAGSHKLSIEGIKEQLAIKEIRIAYVERPSSYESYKEANASKPTPGKDQVIKIQAELPVCTSTSTTSATYDKSSAITEPQSADAILYNTLGSGNWSDIGQSVSYKFNVEEAGMYTIALRFRQSTNEGMFSSRSLKIDGEIPFSEASNIRFGYSSDWQSGALSNADTGEVYEFYLDKGEHTITLEAVLGNMGSVLAKAESILTEINSIYRSVLMYTGATPDEYRNYNFSRYIPDVMNNMKVQSDRLYEISSYLEEVVGAKGETSVTIDKIAYMLKQMYEDEDNIASNFSSLKTNIGTLGTWINGAKAQPLEVDFFQIQPAENKLPKDNANFFQALWHEMKSFIASFYTDYTSMGVIEETASGEETQVWMYTGRDQMQILRNMINDDFTVNTGIKVNLKLVTPTMLMPATLSGAGPDVSMNNTSANTINYAIRSAVQPIMEDWSDYDEVCSRFNDASLGALKLYNADYGRTLLYGLPETQTFPMMFYRTDIFAELGLEIPETWSDLYDIIPVLQANNLTVGIPVYSSSTTNTGTTAATAFMTSIYYSMMVQKGEGIFKDPIDGDEATYGMAINFDSNIGLDCFKELVEYFSMYQLSVSYDFANRFRTGEMPLAIEDYTAYNKLMIFAPEISGLWEMTHIPGTVQSDGSINYQTVSAVNSVMMMHNEDRDEKGTEAAWEFMKWWTSVDVQSRYSTQMVSLLGASGQQSTANVAALDKLPWPSDVLKELKDQFNNIATVPEMPGSYIIARNVEFAFLNAYNNSSSPVDSMLEYVSTINEELSRKRGEFDLPTLENYKEYLEAK